VAWTVVFFAQSTPPAADSEFGVRSGIALGELTPIQIENLVTLGRVWGFLKYHHPRVTAGERSWDYDLFRIMPVVLAAPDRNDANIAMARWIDELGPVSDCVSCVHLEQRDIALAPDLGWIDDRTALGDLLSGRLQRIYANRVAGQQFYVSLVMHVGNPSFHHEDTYAAIQFPDSGYQLLALYRFWNIMQYWSPYRAVAEQAWAEVLAEFIPKVALAKDKDAFQLAMMVLIAKANDTHANLWSSIRLRPPAGDCVLPIDVRFVDRQAVVTGNKELSMFRVGDVIEAVDGVPLTRLLPDWKPFYADSNDAARSRDTGRSLTRGRCGGAKLQILRDGEEIEIASDRLPQAERPALLTHDLAGDTFRLLSKDVAYLKLSSVKATDVRNYIDQAKGTNGLVVDIRNYPSEFVVFALGSLVVTKDTPFARFTVADLSNPGAFHFGNAIALNPGTTYYRGKVVILVDENTQSQAEYTTMALQSTPNAIVVGSQTAGADGNVSPIPLPGGLSTLISGIGVYYPDKAPTQRVGVRIDVKVEPSLNSIRAGRDEVLEVGIRQILGDGASSEMIEKMARP
jgi:C-terminal processing protease CtpA/Prc